MRGRGGGGRMRGRGRAVPARTEPRQRRSSRSGMLMMAGAEAVPVKPAEWKRDLRLARGGKEASVSMAGELVPQLRPYIHRDSDHGRAEAALIALWGLRAVRGVVDGGA